MTFRIIILSISILWAGDLLAQSSDEEVFLNYPQAKKKWGEDKLDIKLFQNTPLSKRASLGTAILGARNQWKGKTRKEVIDKLGETSGHYWSERFPTYIIETGLGTLQLNTWQLVFFVDSTDRVQEAKIHLNCCSAEIWKKRGVKPPPGN